MTRHFSRTLVARLTCIVLSVAATAHTAAAQNGGKHPWLWNARVGETEVTFYLPRPYQDIDPPKPPLLGHYAWRITVEADPQFSIVAYTPAALASGNHAEIVKRTIVRRCPSGSSPIAECVAPVKATIQLFAASVHIVLKDEALIARLRRMRPEFYWRTVIEPGGHYMTDQRMFSY